MPALVSLVSVLSVIVTGVLIALKIAGQFSGSWLLVFAIFFADVALVVLIILGRALLQGGSNRVSDVGSFFTRRSRLRAMLKEIEDEETNVQDPPRPPNDSATWWEQPRRRT